MKKFPILLVLAALSVAAAHYLVFVFVPMEAEMRAVQRIFYFHVPSAWLCFIGFLFCFGGSLAYLWSRKSKFDLFARASAEVGLMFGMIVLTTGPLWARGAWGVWWKWEPRLTTMALLILIFAAYWVLRVYGGQGEGIRKFSAFLAVLATPNIYFVRIAVKKWRGDHPDNVISRSDPDIRMTMYICFFVLLLVFSLVLYLRYTALKEQATVSALRRRFSKLGV
jgi:heme exporter protein C